MANITEADIAAADVLLDKYRSTKSAPRQAICERAGETATLPSLIRETTDLLSKRLDRFMKPFRTSHREFFAGYASIRTSIDLSRNRRAPVGSPRTPAPATPLPVSSGTEASSKAAA